LATSNYAGRGEIGLAAKKERDEMVTLLKYYDVQILNEFPPTSETNGKLKHNIESIEIAWMSRF